MRHGREAKGRGFRFMSGSGRPLTVGAPYQDQQELAMWVAAYGPGLRRFFRRRVNDADVDDLVQDVFVKLQAARTSTRIDNVERYLFAIARNVLVSRYRAQTVRSAALHDPYEETLESADQISPERIAIGREEYARVVQAILNLPPRARAAFQFHRFEHLTYQAIAQRMGISKESVKELMHRALVRITEAMEAEG